MKLVLLGPPGAGKGTQAEKVSRALAIMHVSSGDILRAERKAKSDLGREAQDYMDRGVLVPDHLILSMMVEHIGRPEAARGFLLDGFPRTLAQAEGLDARLAERGRRLDRVVNIEVPDPEVIRRLSGRANCPKCNRIYHDSFSPPETPGVCDDCGERLTRRRDDSREVVGQRLRTYHEETMPLVAYYRDRGILRQVSGLGDVEDVSARIREACGP